MTRSVLRQLSRSPGFSLTVVAFLGVSVAALLALATAGWALLGKPLPFPDGDRLVNIYGYSLKEESELGFAVPLAVQLGELDQVEALGFQRAGSDMEDAQGVRLQTSQVSPSLLRMLGASPLLGRLPAEDEPLDNVMISETFWENRFNRDPGVLDRMMELPGRRLRVIGVLRGTFGFPRNDIAIWQPLVFTDAERASRQMENWGALQVYARLRPGVSATALAQAIRVRWEALPELAPMRASLGLEMRVTSLRARLAEGESELLAQLSLATVLVLLTLAANLANLWLGRTLARRHELAIRGALGASGWRVTAPVLLEIALLTFAGVILGLLLAPSGLDALQALQVFDGNSPLSVRLDATTAMIALMTALLLVALLSIGPLWLTRGLEAGSLGGGPRTLTLSSGGSRLRRGLVAFQVAVAITLLVGGGLLLRSMDALLATDTGFSARDVVVVAVTPKDPRVAGTDLSAGQRVAGWHAEVSALPGVKAASFAIAPPFSQSEIVSTVRLLGDPHEIAVRDRIIGPGYFDLTGQAVSVGRAFRGDDAGAVIVDTLFVQRNLPGIDPLQARLEGSDKHLPTRIIGVVPTIKHASLDETASMGTMYRQVIDPGQPGILPRYALLSTDGAGSAMRTRLEELARAHGLRLERVDTIEGLMRASLSARTPLMWLLGGFSVTCLLLCCTGLFALVQFTVRSRRGEFGLKLALGATAGRLSRQVLLGALRSMWLGMALGVIGALAIGRLLSSRLYQVSPYDPVTLALVAATLLAVAMAAAWWPARHAGRVAPIEALRQE
jgi:predicted permease